MQSGDMERLKGLDGEDKAANCCNCSSFERQTEVPDAHKISAMDPASNGFKREETSGVVPGLDVEAFNGGRAIPAEDRPVDHLNKFGGDAKAAAIEVERWRGAPKLTKTAREKRGLGCEVNGEEGHDGEE